jgi:hypothetical protein
MITTGGGDPSQTVLSTPGFADGENRTGNFSPLAPPRMPAKEAQWRRISCIRRFDAPSPMPAWRDRVHSL